LDEQGSPITSATLYYKVNGIFWIPATMTPGNLDSFSANIPGQPIGSWIEYYISATDGTDTYKLPELAPAQSFRFDIENQAVSEFSLANDLVGGIILDWVLPNPSTSIVGLKIYRSEIESFVPGSGNLIASIAVDTTYLDNTVSDFHTYFYVVGADYSSDVVMSAKTNILVSNNNLTTVLGNVYLEGQTNHANIKVKFHAVSPSAVQDSTYTNALGYFETTVVPGIYHVTYEKVNYQTYYRVEDMSIIADHDFGESTILQLGTANVNGNVSGVWTGIYTISGDIIVPNGDSLTIMPGSEIRFLGNYNVLVYGYLHVAGVEGDSVLFTSAPYNQIFATAQWQGIDFYDAADDSSKIEYAIVRYAVDGIYCEEAQPLISNCKIHHCSDRGIQLNGDYAAIRLYNTEVFSCYDGMYNYNAAPHLDGFYSHNNSRYGLDYDYSAYGTIENSNFSYNGDRGMRLYYYASPVVRDCEIHNNNSWGIDIRRYSSPRIESCTIANNSGYGIAQGWDGYSYHSTDVVNCLIEGNTSWGVYLRHYCSVASELKESIIRFNGGGIYIYYDIDGSINNNLIYGNNSHGIYMNAQNYSDTYIHHNLIAYNNGDGIYRSNHNGNPVIEFNTIASNNGDGFENNRSGSTINFNSNIVVNNNGYGVRTNQPIQIFEYNDIYSNGTGEVSNSANLPVNGWSFVSFNALNDSADIYLNISEDPLFVYNDSLDYHLTSASPCINTGNPAELDPDGTTVDLGAYYFESGYPHAVYMDGYTDQTVSISWDSVAIDTLQSYKIYYKLNSASSYTYFSTESGFMTDVTGLTNDSLYDFTVTGFYPNFESDYAPKVSGTPGIPDIDFDPVAFNLTLTTDTLIENLEVINNGTKDLSVYIPQGTSNRAMHFDGSWDYLYTADPTHLEGMTAFTIECWVYRQASGHMEFVSKHYRQFSLYISSSNYFGLYKGYTYDLYGSYGSGYQVPVNEWHHLAVSWEGSVIKFYVDGQYYSQTVNVPHTPIPNNSYNFEIGCRASDHNHWFNGYLSEVRIWDYSRSDTDISVHMNTQLTGTETGLLGYWPLKNNANDYSSYALNLTGSGNIYYANVSIPTVFDEIPYYLPNGYFYTVPAAGSLLIPFGFLSAGQSGTHIYTQHLFTNIIGNTDVEYEMALTFGQTVPSTPVHFTPVDSTGLPYNIIVTNAEIDGTQLAVGDEIGVYDGATCVGAGIFDGTFNFALTVWEADPGQSLAGFTAGNTISYIIYDASADLEATVEASYEVGDGTFGFGEFTACSLSSTVYKIQTIPVTANMFNLVSFNKLPRYSQSEVVFGGLNDLQIVYNDDGFAWIPPYNINSLGDIYFKDGYHLYSTTVDTILYEGTLIDALSWPIHVESGRWNSIAYLGESIEDVTSAIEGILFDSIDIMQNSLGHAWIPGLGINSLDTLVPGFGYQVALSSPSDIDITYQVNNLGAKSASQETLPVEYFVFDKTGLPYQIVIEMNQSESIGLLPMDEIAVYDGDRCVGAVVYNGEDRLLLTAWSAAEKQGVKGFDEGNLMQFKAYSSVVGEMDLNPAAMNGKDNLTFKGSYYAHVGFESDQGELNIACYPNPFTESTRISLNLNETSLVEISLMDLAGKEIKVLVKDEVDKGNYTYIWNGSDAAGNDLPSGIYMLKIRTGEKVATQKLIKL
jgi:parallel beta-helix repeat protein